MINPCLNCKRKTKCKTQCYYKKDYIKHKKRMMKENAHLYNFEKFLEWLGKEEAI